MNGTRQMQRSGFSLIEMLVVIGIIAVLTAASLAGYSHVTRSADRVKEQELVDNIATALTVIYQQQGSWPRRLAKSGSSGGLLDQDAALAFVKAGVLNLSHTGSGENMKLSGLDRFGILTPWGQAAVRRLASDASLSAKVGEARSGSGNTVQDHILHFALDLDGDGIIKGASVGGASVDVRAQAIVWSCGRDGVVDAYKIGGGRARNCDDVYSWQPGQTKEIK